jgi:ABC-type methionine transport system ATPase subunit
MTIEIFKTNVHEACHAKLLLDEIHSTLKNCQANFDLHDCDKILRVEMFDSDHDAKMIIAVLRNYGFHAEVLADEVPRLHNLTLEN